MTALEQEGPYLVRVIRSRLIDEGGSTANEVTVKRAFAALGDLDGAAGARQYVFDLVNEWSGTFPRPPLLRAIEALAPGECGRFSIPDETVIEVEKTTYEALSEAVGYGDAYRAGTFSDKHALAYFNFDASHPVCACGAPSLDRNHLACGACIQRACEEKPVLDTVAVRFVRGYPSASQENGGAR